MGYIYQIVNDVNEKVYVGKTELTIEQRWKQHLRDSKKENIKIVLFIKRLTNMEKNIFIFLFQKNVTQKI